MLTLLSVACGSSDAGGGAGGASGAGGAAGDSGTDASGVCGDGIVNGSEECDDGPGNHPGSGCEPDCRLSCHSASDCDDGEPCNGAETCQPNSAGRACTPGAAPADGSACAKGGYCKDAVCTQPVCGNGVVEPGEGCEPPGSATCSADCQVMVCGDGAIVGSEQCDDGNNENLDGCDASCRYETVLRFSSFEMQTGPAPSFCAHPANALGSAFAAEAVQALNKNIQASIDGGIYNLMLSLGGLDDLTGTNAVSLDVGLLSGTPDTKDPKTWTPATLDAWYLADSSFLDPAGKPNQFIQPASITAGLLAAGPSQVNVPFIALNTLDSRDTSVRARIDTSPAPDVPAPPPGALAPGLEVLRSIDGNGSDLGACGAATVASLAKQVLAEDFALGPNACLGPPTCAGVTYTYCGPGQGVGPTCNSLLDVLVGGCKVTSLCVPIVKPTQPDVGTGGNPPATLTLGAYNKVTPTVPSDAYSYYLRFAATRAHFTNSVP